MLGLVLSFGLTGICRFSALICGDVAPFRVGSTDPSDAAAVVMIVAMAVDAIYYFARFESLRSRLMLLQKFALFGSEWQCAIRFFGECLCLLTTLSSQNGDLHAERSTTASPPIRRNRWNEYIGSPRCQTSTADRSNRRSRSSPPQTPASISEATTGSY